MKITRMIGVENTNGVPPSVSSWTDTKSASFAESFEESVAREPGAGDPIAKDDPKGTAAISEDVLHLKRKTPNNSDITASIKIDSNEDVKGQKRINPSMHIAGQTSGVSLVAASELDSPALMIPGESESMVTKSDSSISERDSEAKFPTGSFSAAVVEIVGGNEASSLADQPNGLHSQNSTPVIVGGSGDPLSRFGAGVKGLDKAASIIEPGNPGKLERGFDSLRGKASKDMKTSSNKKVSNDGLGTEHAHTIAKTLADSQAVTNSNGPPGATVTSPAAFQVSRPESTQPDDHSSVSTISSGPRARGNIQSIEALKDSSGISKTDKETANTASDPEKAQNLKSETIPSVDQHGSVSAVVHSAEKVHTEVVQMSQNLVSGVAVQIHSATATGREKNLETNSVPVNMRADSGAPGSHLYVPSEQKTLTATPTALEVGISGGSHGWLKVRAELGGDGAVHASMSASTAAGTEMLRRELPSLTSYLHQEQVGVSSVAVHAPSSSMNLSDMSGGSGQSLHAERDASGSQSGRQEDTTPLSRSEEGPGSGVPEDDGGAGWSPSMGYTGAGGWLSVRA